jgi:hypothetical protein
METLAKADIFFVVTTAAIVFGAIALVIIAAYVVRILRDVKRISRVVKDETEGIAGDIDDLRLKFRSEGIGALLRGRRAFEKGSEKAKKFYGRKK